MTTAVTATSMPSTTVAVNITNTTSATSTASGALQVAGGVGVGGNIVVGGYGQFIGTYTEATTVPGAYIGIAGTPGATTPRFGFFNGTASQNWQIDNNSGTFRWFTPGVSRMELSPTGILSVLTNTNSTSALTGAIVVTGGVGVGGSVYVSGVSTFTNTLNVTSSVVSNSTSTGQALLVAGGIGANIVTATIIYDIIGNVRNLPLSNQTTGYTLAASDNGKIVSVTGAVTVPFNVFTTGNNVTIYNNSAVSIAITSSTGLTIYLAGTNTQGNRTLAQHGVATLLAITTTTYVISGSGLT